MAGRHPETAKEHYMRLVVEEIPTELMALPQTKATLTFNHSGVDHSSFVFFYGHDDPVAVLHHVEKLLTWKDETTHLLNGTR